MAVPQLLVILCSRNFRCLPFSHSGLYEQTGGGEKKKEHWMGCSKNGICTIFMGYEYEVCLFQTDMEYDNIREAPQKNTRKHAKQLFPPAPKNDRKWVRISAFSITRSEATGLEKCRYADPFSTVLAQEGCYFLSDLQ